METGISKAIRLAGSQTALGNLLGLTPQAIQKWATQGFVPGDRCREVEMKLGAQVTRYELNPAVFGDDPSLDESSRLQRENDDASANSYSRRKDDCGAASTT
jgi:DNA-binding transcriptional regulator YdaS (Cro superfamily)